MIFKKLLTVAAAFLVSISISFSQSVNTIQQKFEPQSAKLLFKSFSQVPVFLKFKPDQQPAFENFEQWIKKTMGLDASFGLKLLTQDKDQIGFTHYRYQQLCNGLPVENTMYLVHVKNGKIVSMNGVLFDKFYGSDSKSLEEAAALKKALDYTSAKTYMWDDPMNEQMIKLQQKDMYATWFPKGELVYVSGNEENYQGKLDASSYRLAYKFDVFAVEPMSRKYIYVDAQTGAVIATLDRIHTSDSIATAKTAMSDTQRIITDYYAASSFRLRESARGAGNGIETYNLQKGTNYGSAVDFTDTDTFWNNTNSNYDEYATDAHFGSEKTYDYYYNIHGRNSIDGSGLKLVSYIHYSNNFVNAFWNGSYMTYGDGNGSNIKPLVSIDIAGHEITHGLTSYTAALNYSYESGALNESFSDCFGTAIEWYGDSNKFEWDLATKIGWTIRSMGNPKSKNQPDTYYGQNWYTGAADNGGVHTNSGVQNYWFYLLSKGDTGTNDNGEYYNVDSIGMEKAAAIAFRNLTYYLYSSAQYDDARTYSIQAAEDLYGSCSNEEFAVAAAWHAVGVGSVLTNSTNVSLQQNTQNITPGTTNNVILRVNIAPACNALDTAFSFTFNTNGSSNTSDIKAAKLYYTGVGTTFNTLTQFGSAKTSPSGSFTFTGSQELAINSDNYFWLVYDIDSFAKVGDSLDAELTTLTIDTIIVPTVTAPAGYRQINYCVPKVTYGCYSGGMCISNVEISNLANKTGNSCNSKAYNDYTNKVADFEQGQTYNTKLAITTYDAYLNVWIDFDDDGNFNNTNERLLHKYLLIGNNSGDTLITIPSNAPVGYHRMRVRHQYAYYYSSLDACADGYYGEIEDYTAHVMAPSNMVINSSNVFQITKNVIRGTNNNEIVRLKVNAWGSLNPLALKAIYGTTAGTTNVSDLTNAKVYFTGPSSSFNTTTQVGTTINNPNGAIVFTDSVVLNSGSNNFWICYSISSAATLNNYADATCDSFDIAGNMYIPDTAAPYGNRKIFYCLPPASGAPCAYMYINNVTIDSINNNSGCSSSSYSDFTNLATTTNQGDVVSYSVNMYQYDMYTNIWVDWDNNGVFDTAELVLYNKYSTGRKVSGTFTVPVNTRVGDHIVRVMSDYYSLGKNPCTQLSYGETEDYMLHVDTVKNMNYIFSKTTQNTTNVSRNSANNHIIGIKIYTLGVNNPLAITNMYFNTGGTTDTSEIKNAKVWYTGSSPVFAATTQFGSTITYPGNKFSIAGNMNLATSGYNYFWLTYDIASNAKMGNHVDAGCDSMVLSSVTYQPDTANPIGDRKIYYCIPPTSTYPCYMYISKVVLDSINNTSGCNYTSYSDFTNNSTTAFQGDYVNYTVTSVNYQEYINIWVDFDDNGVFDSVERVVANHLTTTLVATGSFLVPANTPVGSHQVRIKADYYTSYANSACNQFIYGETEDYTLNIGAAKAMSYLSANNIQKAKPLQPNTTDNDIIHLKINVKGAANPLAAKSFTFYTNGTSNTNDISNAKVWYTGTDSNFSATQQFGSTVSAPGSSAMTFNDSVSLQSGTNYFWLSYDIKSGAQIGDVVDATCTSFTLNTTAYSPDTAAPYGSRKIDYCTPTGGAANYYNNTYKWGITKVALSNLSNSTGVPTSSAAYYSDYTSYSASLVPGTNYKLYVDPGASATTYPQATIAWVDWNQNAVFDSAESLGANYYHTKTDTITLNVPSNQASGKYRLRIMSGYYYYFYTGATKFNPCYVANTNLLDVGECEDYTIDVVGAPKPVITPNSSQAFCLGSGQWFTANYDTGYTYQWYKNGSTLLQSGKAHPYDSLYYNPSSAGTDSITVKITDSYNQSVISAAVGVTVYPKAVGGTAGLSSSNICMGDSVSLTLSGSAGNIQWQYNNAGVWTNAGSSANPYKVSPSSTTAYRAYLSSGTCPNDSSNQTTLTVYPKSVGGTAALSSSNICSGDSVDLSVSGSVGTIDWQYNNAGVWTSLSSSANPYRISATTTTPYRAFLTSGTCNSDSSNQVVLTVNAKANAGNVTASQNTICKGDSAYLSISNYIGAVDWQYDNGSGWQSLGASATSIYVSAQGNYRAVVSTASCGTDSSKTITITITPPAAAGSIFASATSLCVGDSALLALTGNTGNIQWQYNTGSAWQNLGATSNNIYVSPTSAVDYRAVVTSGSCGSDTSKTISIAINPEAVGGTASTKANAVCPGAATDITLSGNTGTIVWQYYNGSTWVSAGNTTATINVSPTTKTNYRALVTTVCGSDSSNVVTIDVHPAPQAVITPGGPKDLCDGDSIILSAGSANIYNWSNGMNTSTLVLKQTATVSVTITDANGCTATSANNTYTFHSPAVPILSQQNDTLFASPTGATSYIWKLAGNTVSTTLVNYYLPTQKGYYTVEYIDSFGCHSTSSTSINFNFVGVSNVYTPNSLRVWPNPSEGIYNIIATVGNTNRASLRITDMTGKLVQQEITSVVNGNVNTAIDLSKFAKGIYLLYIDTELGKTAVPVKLVKE